MGEISFIISLLPSWCTKTPSTNNICCNSLFGPTCLEHTQLVAACVCYHAVHFALRMYFATQRLQYYYLKLNVHSEA